LAQKLNNHDKSLDSLLNSAETGSVIPTEEEAKLRNDIQRTLSSLSDLIQTKLAPAAERSGKSQHQLLVKRYREILFDLTGDFQKTSALFTRKKEQLELFAGANTSAQGNANEQDEAMQHLMRERNHIMNSIDASAAVIHQAAEIHSDLRSQGMSLRGVQGTILRITSNIPGLNRLVETIRRRRSRDDMILSGVIASCILFTLWYIFG
jgi:golgi SNAP receptor complex member 1